MKRKPVKTYVTHEKELNRITTYEVGGVRNILRPGDKVKAEIWKQVSYGDRDGLWVVTDVRILERYPFIALTDKGAVTWKNIVIHNQHLIRKASVLWTI